MSTPPRHDNSRRRPRRPVTLTKLGEMRALGEPIVMVTAYDHPSAQVAEAAGVDIVLVGDSAANNVLGYPDTVPVTVDELLMLAAAVRRGLRTPLLVGDLPFGSYEASDEQAIATAHRFVKEAGCDAVKIEGSAERARAIVRAGVPVMGHVGLTPQTATALGGYRAQGRTAERARAVLDEALALQEAGCFAIVFEAIPAEVTDVIMDRMEIPVIGIGAGASTDGQVLVLHDMLGIHGGFLPKFVKRYADVRGEMLRGMEAYAEDVRTRALPGPRAHVRDRPGGAAAGSRSRCASASARKHSFTTTLARPWFSSPSCSLPRSASSSTCSRRPARTSCSRPACSSGWSRSGPSTAELARDILVCEQEGDRITHDIIQRLNQTFVTPIDREDIYGLASGLDDIVDWIEEVADFFGLYQIEAPMAQAQQQARILNMACQQVAKAIPRLRGFEDIHHYTVEINRYENEGDRVVREALASLFEAGIDPMLVIRWKDIFERLEDAIDATERVANILEGITIKNT